jgi:hypothetical protein
MAASYKNATIKIEGPDLLAIRNEFKKLPKNIAARVIGAGLRRAAKPGEDALKQLTPKGPTGNLRRAIKTIVKRYPRDGAAVAVVGFVKAGSGKSKSAQGGTVKKGPDRAFHQFWMEFGTKERQTSSSIASSFATLGPFKLKSNAANAKRSRKALNRAKRLERRAGKQRFQDEASAAAMMRQRASGLRAASAMYAGAASRVQTSPAYPKAFFKKSKEMVKLAPVAAQHLVRTAYERSKSAIAANLTTEMQKALENGRKIFEDQTRKAAQMKDLGKHL